MKYIYNAIIEYDDEIKKYIATVPDLEGCSTTGNDVANAIEEITDAASLYLVSLEDNKEPIPTHTSQLDMYLSNNQIITVIAIDTDEYRKEIQSLDKDNDYIKKSYFIPSEYAEKVNEANINVGNMVMKSCI